jgi:hypothetical protein
MSDSPPPANDAEPPATLAPETPANEPLDPEIEALLDFEPVPRKVKKLNGWNADLQRLFIARLAVSGSPNKACDEVRKYRSGVDKLAKCEGAESFRAAWDAAVALAERRRANEVAAGTASVADLKLPFVDNRRKHPSAGSGQCPHPDPLPLAGEGEVLNEYGEAEDASSFAARTEDARDSIGGKLRNCRRLYLREISDSPGKRAAFEILTELPIDWERAARLEAQPDEPWRRPNMRTPDMLLTAENGWLGGMAHGPDKIAELRAAIDEYRAEEGLEPVDWDGSE